MRISGLYGAIEIRPSSSADLNPLHYHTWVTMPKKYHKLQPKHKTTYELKIGLQPIWEERPREHINKAVAIFTKCLTAHVAVAANGGHFKHLHPHIITNKLALFRATNRLPVKTTLGMLRNWGLFWLK